MQNFPLIVIGLVVLSVAARADDVPTVTALTVRGERISAPLEAFDERSVTWTGDRESLSNDALLFLQWDRPVATRGLLQPAVLLHGGERIAGTPIQLADDLLTVERGDGSLLPVPLEYVAAWRPTAVTSLHRLADIARELNRWDEPSDRIVLQSDDETVGELLTLTPMAIEIDTAAGRLTLDSNKVQLVATNPELSVDPPALERLAYVVLTDGTVLRANKWNLAEERFQASLPFGDLELDAQLLHAVYLVDRNRMPLSTLAPDDVTHHPFLGQRADAADPLPLASDRNVRHGPLLINERLFPTGIGTISGVRADWQLPEGFDRLHVCFGIDELADSGGAANAVVMLDGEMVGQSPTTTGREGVFEFPLIELGGASELSLVVNYGPAGDVLDYADWCHAVLIRDP